MSEDGFGGRPGWLLRAAPALTFLVGLVLGGVVVGVAVSGSSPSGTSRPPVDQTSSAGTGSPDVTVTVPGACQDSAALVQRAVGLLRRGAADVRDFQPTDLVDVLNKLETVDTELRVVSTRCSAINIDGG